MCYYQARATQIQLLYRNILPLSTWTLDLAYISKTNDMNHGDVEMSIYTSEKILLRIFYEHTD
jgi:hypothetical protein